MLNPKNTILLIAIGFLGGCATGGSDNLDGASTELRQSQFTQCRDNYYSASASHRSRQGVAEKCDIQRRNNVFYRRAPGPEIQSRGN